MRTDKSRKCRGITIFAGLLLLLSPAAMAADTASGAYATQTDLCPKVFTRKNGKIVFSEMSDMYGSGLIIDGNRVQGKIARCTIGSRKQEKETVHVSAQCTTDIMRSSENFTFRIEPPDRLYRLFPGMEGMQLGYVKCPAL